LIIIDLPLVGPRLADPRGIAGIEPGAP